MNALEFLNITNPFKNKLYRLAKRILVSKEEAEDATQEVLIKLWNNKANIANYKNVEAFSMTMTKNFCLDKLKSKHAQNIKMVHTNYEDKNKLLQKQIEIDDSLKWVEKIIQTLPKQQQLIIQLRDIEQYDFKEISEILNISEPTIRVALSRARKTVREALTKTHDYGIR